MGIKNRISIAVIFIFLAAIACDDKSWEVYIGKPKMHELANSIQQTSDGGYIIGGYTEDVPWGKSSIYIVKAGKTGRIEWSKSFTDDGGHSVVHSVIESDDGGIVSAGMYDKFQDDRDGYIMYMDSKGNVVWNNTYGGPESDIFYSFRQTHDGGYIAAGYTTSFHPNKLSEIYLVKVDSSGNFEWHQTFAYGRTSYARDVDVTVDGGYIVAGVCYYSGNSAGDWLIVKFDSSGDVSWYKTFGEIEEFGDQAYSVQHTSDGGYIAAGYTRSFGAQNNDALFLKLDEYGNLEWPETHGIFGNEGNDYMNSVVETNDGGYIGAGSTHVSDEVIKPYIVKIDKDGNFEWDIIKGRHQYQEAESINLTNDGGYVTCGSGRTFLHNDAFIFKIDKDGKI